jgi:hypothetical protein
MRNIIPSVFAICAVAMTLPAAVAACPLCKSPIGDRVRAHIFNGDFGSHVIFALLPFLVVLAVVALVYFGAPAPTATGRGQLMAGSPPPSAGRSDHA